MMTSRSISAHDLLLDPFPVHTNIRLVTPTDDQHDHGGDYCYNWVSHHHHNNIDHYNDHQLDEQAGSDDTLKHANFQNGIGAYWIWEPKDDHHVPTTRDDHFDSNNDDINENWVPSKLRVVRKMNPKRASTENSVLVVDNTDDYPCFPLENNSSSNNSGINGNSNGIRVCSDCNTTKTPLWRSGPRGPKSLCNACGIRQRKARRALAAASEAAATASDNTATKETSAPKSLKIKTCKSKEKKTSNKSKQGGGKLFYKKRLNSADQSSYTFASQDSNPSCGNSIDDQDSKKLCFEEFIAVSLSKNAALHRVLPQVDKEAAILLMALSCGLVHH